jgi:hypothetical protein
MLRHNGLDTINGTCCASIEGLVGRSDDVNALCHILSLVDTQPGVPWLIDNRECGPAPGLVEVGRLVRFFREHAEVVGSTRVALVNDEPQADAMARVVARRSQSLALEMRAFRSIDEAGSWLAEGESKRTRMSDHPSADHPDFAESRRRTARSAQHPGSIGAT